MVASDLLTRRLLATSDVGAALALSDAAGWNQTADDWGFFIQHGRVLGVCNDDGQLVATAAALPYGDGQAWISMVLVNPAWQHRGLATGLLSETVEGLRKAGITPVLDATPAGEPVYRRLGFEPGLAFERWQAVLTTAGPSESAAASRGATVHAAGIGDIDAIAALDLAANGIHRRALLEAFMSRPGTRAWMTRGGSGFVLLREGRRATQIGPLVAADTPAAAALLDTALAARAGPVFLDVATRRDKLLAWLHDRGFSRQRPFVRMALGAVPALAGGNHQFIMAGPEFG